MNSIKWVFRKEEETLEVVEEVDAEVDAEVVVKNVVQD